MTLRDRPKREQIEKLYSLMQDKKIDSGNVSKELRDLMAHGRMKHRDMPLLGSSGKRDWNNWLDMHEGNRDLCKLLHKLAAANNFIEYTRAFPKVEPKIARSAPISSEYLDQLDSRGVACYSTNIIPKRDEDTDEVIIGEDGIEKKEFVRTPTGWDKFTSDQNAANFNPLCNSLVIVTGSASKIDGLDLDNSEAIARFKAKCPKYAAKMGGWVEESPRGLHLFIKHTGRYKTMAGKNGADMRAEGGMLISAPSTFWRSDGTEVQYTNVNNCFDPIDLDEEPEIAAFLAEEGFLKQEPATTAPVAVTRTPQSGEGTVGYWESLLGLLNTANYGDSQGHSKWVNICYAITRDLGEEGRGIFVNFSQKCSINKAAEADAKYTYCLASGKKQVNRPVTYRTVQRYAQQDSPDEYEQVFGKQDAGVRTDKAAAEMVSELYPFWVCCNDTLYVADEDTGMYGSNKHDYYKVFGKFERELLQQRSGADGKVTLSDKGWGNTKNKMDALPELLKGMHCNNSWLRQMSSSSLGWLLFPNGTLNCKTGEFHNKNDGGFFHDLLFMDRIENDWVEDPTEEDLAYDEDVKRRIFTDILGKTVGEYTILMLSRALAGDRMKNFVIGIAKSNSGKSTITQAVLKSIGGYGANFDGNVFLHRNTSNDAAQMMRPFMLTAFKRICISNELNVELGDKSAVLDGTMIKKCSSGCDTCVGRGHGGNETEFEMHSLRIMFANDMCAIKPLDDAVMNRIRAIPFNKVAVSKTEYAASDSKDAHFPIDEHLGAEILTPRFQQAMVRILMRAYLEFQQGGCVMHEPPEVMSEIESWVGSSAESTPLDAFKMEYDITNNPDHYVKSCDLEMWLKTTGKGWTMKRFAKVLKEEGCKLFPGDCIIDNKTKKIDGKGYKVWVGICLQGAEDTH